MNWNMQASNYTHSFKGYIKTLKMLRHSCKPCSHCKNKKGLHKETFKWVTYFRAPCFNAALFTGTPCV